MDDLQRAIGTSAFLVVGTFVVLAILGQCGCAASRPATYQSELVFCNQTSKTLAESIDCENRVRAAYGRPLRDAGGE